MDLMIGKKQERWTPIIMCDRVVAVCECPGTADLFTAAPKMAEFLQSAVDDWIEEIEGGDPINGSDAVEWLCQFVIGARDLIRKAA